MTPITTECNDVAPFIPINPYIGFKRNNHRDLIRPIHSGNGMIKKNTTHHTNTMLTYEDQVLDAADADGLLSTQLASRLMEDHCTSLFEMTRQGFTGNCRHAESLLEFLGY